MGRSMLASRVALVTGAASGIGRGIAHEFANEGASVAVVDRNGIGARSVVEEITAAGGAAEPYELDVTDFETYRQVVDDVVQRFDALDILVNNAAIALYGTVLEGSLEDWRKVLQVNLEAVYTGSKLVAPYMVEARFGRIISISSVQAFAASGGVGSYNAAKAGIIGLTKSLAYELAPYNIQVNAVAPGFIRTPMSMVDGVDETQTADFRDLYIARRHIPMARAGIPEDVAGAAVFLASDYCRYMTGQVLTVDGGLLGTF